jgi:sterol 24-C-methyltransferase
MWKKFRELRSLPNEELLDFLESYRIFANDDCNDLNDFKNGVVMKEFDDKGCMNDYYQTLHKLCCLGSVEKMYIPPTMDASRSVLQNQLMYEKTLIDQLRVGKGDRVLEVGCGAGRIAAHVVESTGAALAGINIDPTQVASANVFATQRSIDAKFYTADMNDSFPFEDATFDAVYGVQPFTYARDLESVFSEIYRVLKPGGRLVILDCVLLDGFDKSNLKHLQMLQNTRELIGLGGFWHYFYWTTALTNVGFKIVHSQNKSFNDEQYVLIEKENRYFERLRKLVKFLTTIRVLSSHMDILLERFHKHGKTFIEMDKQHLITTSWEFSAVKPNDVAE